jgi:hypothetical protein
MREGVESFEEGRAVTSAERTVEAFSFKALCKSTTTGTSLRSVEEGLVTLTIREGPDSPPALPVREGGVTLANREEGSNNRQMAAIVFLFISVCKLIVTILVR